MKKLCDSVKIMHGQGIAHGSLYSDNVLIIKDDTTGEVENLKLIHFDDSVDTNSYSSVKDEHQKNSNCFYFKFSFNGVKKVFI